MRGRDEQIESPRLRAGSTGTPDRGRQPPASRFAHAQPDILPRHPYGRPRGSRLHRSRVVPPSGRTSRSPIRLHSRWSRRRLAAPCGLAGCFARGSRRSPLAPSEASRGSTSRSTLASPRPVARASRLPLAHTAALPLVAPPGSRSRKSSIFERQRPRAGEGFQPLRSRSRYCGEIRPLNKAGKSKVDNQ